MNKRQTQRLQKFISLVESTPLATRETLMENGEVELYSDNKADTKGRPTIGVLAAKLDKEVAAEPYLSNVGQVAIFLSNVGLCKDGYGDDTYNAAERIVRASVATHSPVQNAKRAAAAIRRFVAQQTA